MKPKSITFNADEYTQNELRFIGARLRVVLPETCRNPCVSDCIRIAIHAYAKTLPQPTRKKGSK